MSDAEKDRPDDSDAADVEKLQSELLVELNKASVPGRIDQLARKLQERLDRSGKKGD